MLTNSPPRRGGVAAPLRKCREATEGAQTGWSDRQALNFAELLFRLRPHPHHAVVLSDAHNTDCTCRSRDAESLALTLSAPAIVPALFFGHVVQISALEHDFRTAAAGFDYSPPAPPPKF